VSAKKIGLGRSFDSLVPTEFFDESFDPTANQDEQVSDLRYVKLDAIIADPDQPRRHFDEEALVELTASIKEHGVLQPIVLVVNKDGYMIVAGERRFRASKRAGLDKIPALVRTLSDQHKLELSLIENLQRRDLNILETATAYAKLRDQFNLTLEQIGQRVGGKTASSVSNTLRLLRLAEPVQQALSEGRLHAGQARPLVGCDEETVAEVLPKILAEGWSARAIEMYIARHKSTVKTGEDKPKRQKYDTAPLYQNVSKDLTKRFKTDVRVKGKAGSESGQLIVSFKNRDEFERIRNLLSDK